MIKKFKSGHVIHVLETLSEMLKECGDKPVYIDGRKLSLKVPQHHGCVLLGLKVSADEIRLPLFGDQDKALTLSELILFIKNNSEKGRVVKMYDERNRGLYYVSRIDDFNTFYSIL